MAVPYVPYDGPIVTKAEAHTADLPRYFTGRPCKRGHVSERFTSNLTCARCCVEQHDERRDRINDLGRQRRANDPEKYRAKDKTERLANPDGRKASALKWRGANLQRSQATARAWKQRNAARVAAYVMAYYAKTADARRTHAAVYRAANLAMIKAKKLAKYAADGEADRAYSRAWYAANAETFKAKHRAWMKANPGKSREYETRRRALKVNAEGDHTTADVIRIGGAQGWKCHWCGKPTRQKYHVDHIIPLSKGGGNGPGNLAIACVGCNQSKWASDPIVFARRLGLLV
jgi:5-methylcytosine-specific restriction endonuclease McrA